MSAEAYNRLSREDVERMRTWIPPWKDPIDPDAWDIDSETGLPNRPPRWYAEDGYPRCRICKRCRARKPIDQFPRLVRPWTPICPEGVYRRRTCTDCDSRARLERQYRQDRTRLTDELAKLPKIATSADAIRNLLDQVAENIGGSRDFGQIAELWASSLKDPDVSPTQRTASARLALFARIVADLDELETRRQTAPDFGTLNHAAYVHWLAERGHLAGLIRAALTDGIISLDQIDPPPPEWSEDWHEL